MATRKKLRTLSDKYEELEDLCDQLVHSVRKEDLEDIMSLKEQIDEAIDIIEDLSEEEEPSDEED